MLFDIETIKINSTLDLSLIFAILGVIIYYFGKIHFETSYKKEQNFSIYFQGLVFLTFYLIFPAGLIIYLFKNFPVFSPLWSVIFQILIFSLISLKFKVYEFVDERGIKKQFIELVKIKFEKMKETSKIRLNNFNFRPVDILLFNNSNIFLLILSTLELFFFINTLYLDNFLIQFFSVLLLISSISFISILDSWNTIKHYPKIKVLLENNNEEIKGILKKLGNDYLIINSEKNSYYINLDKIIYLEFEEFKYNKALEKIKKEIKYKKIN